MKLTITLAAFLLLNGLGWHFYNRRRAVEIPMCGVSLQTPLGCATRKWGNALEINCSKGNKIVYCNDLKQASPK
jgi:hypothetical protein